MNEKKNQYWPGLLVAGFLAVVEGLFLLGLAKTGLLPVAYLLIGVGGLLVLVGAVYLLVRRFDRKGRFAVGCVVTAVLVAFTGVAYYYVGHGVGALGLITQPESQVAGVGVYVAAEDAADSIQATKGYTFGVLATLDRSNTDAAADQLATLLGEKLEIREYAGLSGLVDGLLTAGEVDALLLNVAFLDLLEDMEGYETVADRLRQVFMVQVTETTTTTQPTQPEPEVEDTVFTMYISGIDATGGISVKSRSDVNILATVNTETGQVLLISTPRDYYVPLSISHGIPDKLTHAGIYGIDVSVDTLEMLYDTQIDYYFRVNFTGFEKIIDALGGITVHSQYAFTSKKQKFVQGANQLNGAQALIFSRARYTVPGGDRQRGRNQMAVIKGVIDKMTSPALLGNFTAIMDGVANSFETSVPYEEITAIVRQQLSRGTKWNVTTYSVDGTGATRAVYSLGSKAYVMLPDEETVAHAKELIKQVENGEIPTP
ncbi:MAG: LCP family protein [Clostridia bacterium]|nr:LCP family protein [Clostridia bacterium]